mmetsp:Transcript_62457/g.183098  ORF Transcript_62457/g.183098 Transcript_62457/m.183098 type:complete len:111 (-) Transcript_62457:36-368(-)
MSAMKIIVALLAVANGAVLRKAAGPEGAGIAEPTMAGACAECAESAPYLDKTDDCSCHATNIMNTFEGTKKLTVATKYGSKTTESAALAAGWMWHCRPITATEGVWKQCV